MDIVSGALNGLKIRWAMIQVPALTIAKPPGGDFFFSESPQNIVVCPSWLCEWTSSDWRHQILMAHFPEAIDVTICTAELLIPRSWQGRDQWNHRAPPGEEGKDIGWPIVDQILKRNKLVALLLSTKPFYSVNVCCSIWQEFVGSPLIHATHFNSRFFPHLDRGSVSPLNFFEEHGGAFSSPSFVRFDGGVWSCQTRTCCAALQTMWCFILLDGPWPQAMGQRCFSCFISLHARNTCSSCSRWD